MSDRAHEGQTAQKKINADILMAVATDDPNVRVDEGQYVGLRASRSGELYTKIDGDITISSISKSEGLDGDAAPSYSQKVGGLVSTNQPAHTAGDLEALSIAPDGDARVTIEDAQGTPDAAAPDEAVMVGGTANAASPSLDEGDLFALSGNLAGEARVDIESAQAAAGATNPGEIVLTGGIANTGVPTAVTNGQTVNPNIDEYGMPRIAGYGYGTDTLRVTDEAPIVAQKYGPEAKAALTAAGSTAAVNCEDYKHITWQIVIASIDTSVDVRVEGSMDGTSWFNLDDAEVDTQYVLDGTYSLRASDRACKYTRLTFVSEAGGTGVTVTGTVMLGN